MRTKTFFYNSLSSILLQIITMVVGFIIPRLLLETYGSEINGLVASILQFISYFTLIEAGLSAAAVYALYKPLADQNYSEVNSILTASKKFYNQTGTFFILLILGFSFFFPIFVDSTLLSSFEVGVLVIVLGSSGAIDFFIMSKYRVLLTAMQKVYVISYSSISYILLNTIILFTLSHFKVHISVLYSISLFSVLLKSVIMFFYVKKHYHFVNYNHKPNFKALDKRWDALYLQVLGSLRSGTPVVVATIFTSLNLVSVYSIYNLVFMGISGILSIFISGLSSSFGDVIARGQQKIFQQAYQEFEFTFYLVTSWAYSCALILIMPFISIYTNGIDDTNYYIPLLGVLFTLNGVLLHLKTPQGMLVISAGMYRQTRVQSTIQGLIGVVASIIFVQFWGIEGILIGMCLSEFYRVIDLLIFIPNKLTKLKISTSLYRIIRVIFIVALCYAPFLVFKLKPNNIYEWLLDAVAVSIYCIVVTLFFNYLLDRAILISVFTRIMNMLKLKIPKRI